jgi:hypothetical protein
MQGYHFQSEWNAVSLPFDQEIWTHITAPHEGADVDFKATTDKLYRTGQVIHVGRARLRASRNAGQPVDTLIAAQLTRRLAKYREAFCMKGPLLRNKTTRETTAGLFNKAGNTSTYTTVKFAAASGPYNAVLDMWNQNLADGFGTGRLDVVTDTTLAQYFKRLPATDAVFSEGTRIKQEILNGGDIYISDQTPSADSNDGVLLLVENSPLNYKIKSPDMITLVNEWQYLAEPDEYVARIDLAVMMHVYQANAICKHMTVDLA